MESVEAIGRKAAKILLAIIPVLRRWFSHPIRLWCTLFLAVFAFSLLSFALRQNKLERITLFFPRMSDGNIIAETRYVPLRPKGEAWAEILAKEIALGPLSLFLGPVLPEGVELDKTILRGGALYLDFGSGAVFRDGLLLDIESNLELIKKSIFRNFPSLKKIVITLGGYQAYLDHLEE